MKSFVTNIWFHASIKFTSTSSCDLQITVHSEEARKRTIDRIVEGIAIEAVDRLRCEGNIDFHSTTSMRSQSGLVEEAASAFDPVHCKEVRITHNLNRLIIIVQVKSAECVATSNFACDVEIVLAQCIRACPRR